MVIDSGDAYRGPWRMNDSEFLFVDDPTVSINDNGVIAVAWADLANMDILLQVFEPDGKPRLREPLNVSSSPGIFSWLPKIVINDGDANQIYLLWQDIVFSGGSHGGEIFFARSMDGGRTFDAPMNLSKTIAGAGKGRLTSTRWDNGSFDLVMDENGDLYAAWTDYEGPLWFTRSSDAGETFTRPQHVAGDENDMPARSPTLAVRGNMVYLAWAVGEYSRANIHYSVSHDGGLSFASPQEVHRSRGHADAPNLAFCGEGVLHLVYAESTRGMFRSYDVFYTHRATNAESFAAPKAITGHHSAEFYSAHFPEIDVDGENRLYVLWELAPDRRLRSRGLGLTYSTDGDASFAQPIVVPGTGEDQTGQNGSQQGLLMRKLGVNPSGQIAIVNSTFEPSVSSHIWLFRGELELN